MAIPLSRPVVDQVIQDRWGAIGDLEQGWLDRVEAGFQKVGKARDRKTIYRWLSRGIPNDMGSVFGFASVLGVDPLALLDLESERFQDALRVEWLFFLSNLSSSGKFSALWPLVRPAVHWPSAQLSNDFYDCDWSTAEFLHSAKDIRNVYAQLRLRGSPDEVEARSHRIYYLAYRRLGARDGLWRPYGIVRKRGNEAICVGHNGDMDGAGGDKPKVTRVAKDGALDVETFFGPGPCEFKVACLHPFSLEVMAPSRAKSALRFSA